MMEQEDAGLAASSGHHRVAPGGWNVATATCALKESAMVEHCDTSDGAKESVRVASDSAFLLEI